MCLLSVRDDLLGFMKSTASQVRSALKAAGNPEKIAEGEHFFRAYPGGYGEGDRFYVVPVPEQRKIARQFHDLSEKEIIRLLRDPYHECRLTALFIMVDQFQKGDDETRNRIVTIYIDHLDFVNNWDLVDSSAHKILGASLVSCVDRSVLDSLAKSGHLWRQRVSIVACLEFIRRNDFHEILALAEFFLEHPHDLIHKAVGWMLREVGKRDEEALTEFLQCHYQKMPRTMLRYAIEKFDRSTRTAYLKGTV
jgi:3-methyladenine DNA glycosylase AlkD